MTKRYRPRGMEGKRDLRGWLDPRRNHRKQRYPTCNCGAYKYPHAELGGRCSLSRWVASFYEPFRQECRDCISNNTARGECECESGIESPAHCPELRDYIRNEGIILFGAARRAMDRAQRKDRR